MAAPAALPSLHAPSSPRSPPTHLASEDALHELRVRVPSELHRQLLALKVLRGRSLADTVSAALDLYFAGHAREVAPPADGRAPKP